VTEDTRTALAGFAAVLVPAALGTAILASQGGATPATVVLGFEAACLVVIAYLSLLGLPLWLLLSKRGRIPWWRAGLLGAMVGSLPAALLLLPDLLGGAGGGQAVRILLFSALCGASSGLSIRVFRRARA
jgi:hypothetical protein